MDAIHHQQSGIDLVSRVIIEKSESNRKIINDTSVYREINLGGTTFCVIKNMSPESIELAKSEILAGRTAAIMPHNTARPEALFFDMDATVIAEESLVEIAKAAGKERQIHELTEKAMAGGMDFQESLRQRLAILKGLHRDQIHAIQPTINPGIQQLMDWCQDEKIPAFLVSGGFVDLASPIAEKLGFVDFKANSFAWDGDRMAGRAEGEIIDGLGKLAAVHTWCAKYGLNPKHCIAIGDGANDLPMMQAFGLAVGYSAKKTLWPHIHVSNHTGDHRFLLNALQA